MNLDEALSAFVLESRELLDQMEAALLRVEQCPDDPVLVHEIFRAAHTIKGSAGIFGLDAIVAFTHRAESVLDAVRAGRLPMSPELAQLMLRCADHLRIQVDRIASGDAEAASADADAGAPLAAHLDSFLNGDGASPPATSPEAGPAAPDAVDRPWRLSLRFGRDTFRDGFDPLSFVAYLESFGRIVAIDLPTHPLPPLADLDPEDCHLAFEIRFVTDADRPRIESAFEFVREGSEIRILAPGEDDEAPPPAAVPVPAVPPASPTAPEAGLGEPRSEASSLRVDAAKLDRLIDLIGELVIAGAGAGVVARRHRHKDLIAATTAVMNLMEDVRDSALRLRMVPIGGTFKRFQRVVRDVSREIGKSIDLHISGAQTELDKTLVERVADPLTHLVRNAIDHGIESPDERRAAGKPPGGQVRLHACHDAGWVVLEVSDDGRGLNRERILRKAIASGRLPPGAEPTDAEVWQLVFEPGFSTAEQVSDLSGRGVGMDVVKRDVAALRGTVEIDTRPGQGTTVRIRLPLTLAIIDGFLMGVGANTYVVPLAAVVECIELRPGEAARGDWLDLRGEVLPLIRLRDLYGVEGPRGRRQNVVVVVGGGLRVGLVVDQLMGELQSVIKPLGRVFQGLEGIGGFTILGNGGVALLLDVPSLVGQAAKAGRTGESHPARASDSALTLA